MSFRVTGLDPRAFQSYFGRSDAELAAHGVRRCIADCKPGFPDRIELRDAEIGERLLLLNYEHQPAPTPYKASHAIFVLETAHQRYDRIDIIPEAMRTRLISLRAFDAEHDMVSADVVDGTVLEDLVVQFLSDPKVAYLQAHYAKRGCYAARIERA
ncbi:MAG: DUF1203 domain-containing protein [Sinobacteraceae bacterium]|nr:DUF1203 domain-containing protein [Nevskiaceae bacterium]MBV8852515.1 DUF1203 domain-containing protein [Nevskiaceae bacterium]MBV9912205.1 DUF1203 domain-containing protein [Nevskiaceae bacterium]